MLYLAIACYFIRFCTTSNNHATFHIRHYSGKCLEFRETRIVFSSICRDHFKWKGGARLIHVPTNKCLVPEIKDLNLTSNCSGTETLLQYHSQSHSIKHLKTGKFIWPEGNVSSPADNTGIGLSTIRYSRKSLFWLVPQVLYVIRHFSGLCWKYSASDNLIKLTNDYVCDRFLQKNNKHLKHFASGKCVILQNSYLRLTSDCTNSATLFDVNSNNILQQTTSNRCVNPYLGSISPASGTRLVFSGCANEDRIKTYFYDDKGIFNVTLVSNSVTGHIIVNGYQYSLNTRGINIVVFDYRSGIFEQKVTYDVYGYTAHRDNLATFLNNLPSDKVLFMVVRGSITLNNNAASALQKYGVSATFATSNLPKALCPMATVAYTGPSQKSWEKSISKFDCNININVKKVFSVFHDFKGINDCSDEMGIRTGSLPNARFTASSRFDANHHPYNARLHKYTPGWCSVRGAPLSHYLQIDLGAKILMAGIALQGHGTWHGFHFLTQFSIQYSLDGDNWKYYVDESNKAVVFQGVQRQIIGETKVNWFLRTLVRFIRVMPVARDPVNSFTHCIRMELFGCPPKGPAFKQNLYDANGKYILEQNTGNISFHAIPLLLKKMSVGISIAATNRTLANDIDQQDISNVNVSITRSNGNAQADVAKIEGVRNIARGLTRSVMVNYSMNDADVHDLDICITNKILDAREQSGLQSWNVYTFETEKETVVIGESLTIKRRANDKSVLFYNILNKTKAEYKNGDQLYFNVSIDHLPETSYANAYKLELLIYYDTTYLTLTSFDNILKDKFTISPTSNTTRPGVVHFRTEILWLLNKHVIYFNFKLNYPNQIFKGKNCDGAVIVDFVYSSNLAKFHGNVTTSLGKQVSYKCKISQTRSLVSSSRRITVPGFSILFDDVNNDVFICKKGIKYSERNLPSCFVQRSRNISWHGIPYIASVIGIDTSKRMLFGLDPKGNGYVKLDNNLQRAIHVEDVEWISIQNQPHVRKAKTATDVTSLPSALDNAWVFPSPANQIWAATKRGIMKNVTRSWNYIFWW